MNDPDATQTVKVIADIVTSQTGTLGAELSYLPVFLDGSEADEPLVILDIVALYPAATGGTSLRLLQLDPDSRLVPSEEDIVKKVRSLHWKGDASEYSLEEAYVNRESSALLRAEIAEATAHMGAPICFVCFGTAGERYAAYLYRPLSLPTQECMDLIRSALYEDSCARS